LTFFKVFAFPKILNGQNKPFFFFFFSRSPKNDVTRGNTVAAPTTTVTVRENPQEPQDLGNP
jgi:hypothetical protein